MAMKTLHALWLRELTLRSMPTDKVELLKATTDGAFYYVFTCSITPYEV